MGPLSRVGRLTPKPPIGGIGKGMEFPQNSSPCLTAQVATDEVRDARRQPRSGVPGGHKNNTHISNVAASNIDDECRNVVGVM